MMRFKERDYEVIYGSYKSGATGINLIDSQDETLVKATINPPAEIYADEVAIPDFGETKGIPVALKDAGIITDYVKSIHTENGMVVVYKLSEEALKECIPSWAK